jgi:DNA-binding beta-propeller fold protein YncE
MAGKIYVANPGNNTVTTYTANGAPTTPTITTGLNGPEGVTVDATGKIYVANSGNTVTTYTANGKQTTPTITTGLAGPRGHNGRRGR